MFKLNRMDEITFYEVFQNRRAVPLPDLSNEHIYPTKTRVKAVFETSMKWHLIEEFGTDSFTVQSDGRLLFEHEYSDDESLLSWMLSCRDQVTVIEPESVKQKLYQITSNIAKKYEKEE